MFAGVGERIEITHRSAAASHMRTGSLRAARFVAAQPKGLFDMFDVLGLAKSTTAAAETRMGSLGLAHFWEQADA